MIPGLGQLYCGSVFRCLLFAFLMTVPSVVCTILLLKGQPVLGSAFIGTMVVYLGIWLWSLDDARRMALRTRPDYELKDYNRTSVYLLWAMISLGSQAGIETSVRENVIQPYKIPSDSMHPTIQRGDFVMAMPKRYRTEDPAYGDVIVFIDPETRKRYFIKRVVGLPGDTVEILNGRLLINGRELPREATDDPTLFYETSGEVRYGITIRDALADVPQQTVPASHVFTLGDHRTGSKDSRHYGPISIFSIKARAGHIYFPFSRSGPIR
ncbi:MAG: signal peptidase I [Verrucomicrobiota bacterium]